MSIVIVRYDAASGAPGGWAKKKAVLICTAGIVASRKSKANVAVRFYTALLFRWDKSAGGEGTDS